MRGLSLLLGSILLATGCGSDKIQCGTPVDFAGNWTYSGLQSAPTAATLSGTMSITSTGTCTFDGHVSITVDDGGGTPTMLDGGISGVFLNDSTVDFTAQLGGERRHLGTVRADTVAGSWSSTGPGGANGTFRAERAP